ncbi:hypothetical protein CICLE_v10030076mg, partial [Citrus x clementina]
MLKTYPMVGIEGGKLLVIGKLQKKDDVFKVAGAFYGWGKFFHAEKIDLLNPFVLQLEIPRSPPPPPKKKKEQGCGKYPNCNSREGENRYARGLRLPEGSLQKPLYSSPIIIADYLGSGGVGPQVFAVILHNEFLGLESMDKEKVQAINLPFEYKIISGGERRLRCLRQLVTANNNNLDSNNGGSLARLSMRQELLA